jgi:hypothetical protein
MTIEPVRRVLDALGIPFALIGAHAMAARGYPRFTLDIDLLTTDVRVLDEAMWATLVVEGARITPRRGDAEDPLGGVVHIILTDGTDIDLIVAKWQWQADVLQRADTMTLFDGAVRVPAIGDLILLKLAAGGYGDLQDAAALLALGGAATRAHVNGVIQDVRPDVRQEWETLQSRVPGGG